MQMCVCVCVWLWVCACIEGFESIELYFSRPSEEQHQSVKLPGVRAAPKLSWEHSHRVWYGHVFRESDVGTASNQSAMYQVCHFIMGVGVED